MLSRVAENLYWMARYLERAENTARLINTTTQVLLDLPRTASFGWDVLLKVAGLDALFAESGGQANEEEIMPFLIQDPRNPSSMLSCLHAARENARTFREVLPVEIWERVNGLYLFIRQQAGPASHNRTQRYAVLNGVIERCQTIIGTLAVSMNHDSAYQFLKIGYQLERADMTTRIIDVNSAVIMPAQDHATQAMLERLWIVTLKSLSSYQMYRRHAGVHVEGAGVVHFLLANPHFPRSVIHCLAEIEGALSSLPDCSHSMASIRKAWRRVEGMRFEGLTPQVLHDYLDQIQADLATLHGNLGQQCFHRHQHGNLVCAQTQTQSAA